MNIRDQCSSRRLQLNPDRTELIWFGSRVNLLKLKQLDNMSLNLCFGVVETIDSIHDLCLILGIKLLMREHTSKISSICFFHLHHLQKIRPLIDSNSTQRLVSAFILSRVNYCNAVVSGVPDSRLAPLQRVLNAAARFLAGTAVRIHVPLRKLLHWLPIAHRIRFKLCPHARREQRNQSVMPMRYHNTDLTHARRAQWNQSSIPVRQY